MRLVRHADAAAFLQHAGAFLMRNEVANNALLSLARSVADGSRVLKAPATFAAVECERAVVCCALRTPPFQLLLSDGPADAVATIARDLLADGELPGVKGPCAAAAAFASAWTGQRAVQATVNMRLRVHELRELATDLLCAPGELVRATAAERAVALDWFTAFAREATPDSPNDAEEAVDRFIDGGRLYLWLDPQPVTMAGIAGQTAHGARVGPVYTPPALRGRGYATAAVTALSRQLLTTHDYCSLYTNLANPTSNGIYRRIGYRPVCDVDEYTFCSTTVMS
jgi:predicted GNAT family acetyltransferase